MIFQAASHADIAALNFVGTSMTKVLDKKLLRQIINEPEWTICIID